LKKLAVIFTVLSVYIVAAFAWWTYAHIRNSKQLQQAEIENLELMPYRATLQVREAVDQEMFADTNALKKFFEFNYPQLDLYFMPDEGDPLFNYMIVPSKNTFDEINQRYKRKVWMYSLEGIVMVLLLFWGIIWVYHTLQTRLKLKRQQSNFLLSITHELKTPLASIKLYLETLIKRDSLDPQQKQLMLKNSLSDVTRLRDLVDNLLTAAQLDAHKFNVTLEDVNISELLHQTIDKYCMPRNLSSRLETVIAKDVKTKADSLAMEMVFTNLISNAFKYSPGDKKVKVTLSTLEKHVNIEFVDEGAGISKADKEQLFDLFFRAGDENTRKTKGTGLGLYIVKNLLNLHHAEIIVNDNSPSGVIFKISLPYHA
jgi:two-component system, OmpR family, phosphate regulon sensor histidine kinase PhoR